VSFRAPVLAASLALAAIGTAAVVAPPICGTDPDCLANKLKAVNLYPSGRGVNTDGVVHITDDSALAGTTSGAFATPSTTFFGDRSSHGD